MLSGVADVNGDGKPDFVGANGTGVDLLINNGDGTFRQSSVQTPSAFVGVAGDFNGDGKMDIAGIQGGARPLPVFGFLAGNGDGTFRAMASGGTLTDWYELAGAADFNKDGKLDLYFFQTNTGRPSSVAVALGNGDGTFQPLQTVSVAALVVAVVAADFNGDGKMDLAVLDQDLSNILILTGSGNGTFQAGATVATGTLPASLAVGDFNGDGKPDLAAASPGSGAVLVALGNGNGTFQPGTITNTTGSPSRIAIADLNNDKKGDLIVVSGETISIFLGTGTGSFQAPTQAGCGRSPTLVFTGDWNGDSKLDLACKTGGGVALLFGNGDGTLQTTPLVPLRTYLASAAADLNGDGKQDLVAASPDTLEILLGNGDGTFRAGPLYTVGSDLRDLVVGDFNGDGIPDVALLDAQTARVLILAGNGDGTFRNTPYAAIAAGTHPVTLMAADFNRDGRLDLAVGSDSSSSVTVLLANGDGTFRSSVVQLQAAVAKLAAADLDGDGLPDLVASRTASAVVSTLLGKGDGTFGIERSATGASGAALAIADFDRDGKLDVLISGSGGLVLLPGNGDGTLGKAIPLTGVADGQGVVAADFDGDGKLDLLAAERNYPANRVTLLAGNGDGTFQPARYFGGDYNPALLLVADINADGRPDVVVMGAGGSNDFWVLLNNTLIATPASVTITSAPSGRVFWADNIAYATPQLLLWAPNTPHTIAWPIPPASGGVRQGFAGWSDNQTTNPRKFTLAAGAASFKANFSTQYQLTLAGSPADGGSVTATPSSADGYYPAGTLVQLSAVSTPGYTWSGWSGDAGGSVSTASVTLTSPKSVTAKFTSLAVITSPPPGSTLTATAVTFAWNPVTAVPKYKLEIGSALGQADLASVETASTSAAVTLPSDGRTLYARLSLQQTGGYIAPGNFTYTAYTGTVQNGSLRFVAVTPCRAFDTRQTTSIAAGSRRDFAIPQSNCGIPAAAQAYALNVTVVPSKTLGYLSIWPAGQQQPLVSTLNSFDGRVKANAAIVPAGTGGAVSVYVTDRTDVVLDVNGYFVPAGSLAFYPLPPCRLVDTRGSAGDFGGPALKATQTRSFNIAGGACAVPQSAQAYSLNFTVVPPGSLGYLTAWPAGQTQPLVSTLNAPVPAVTANAAIVPAGSGGAISVYATDATDLVLDINGYFAPPGNGGLSFYPLTPCRVVDTRLAAGDFGGPALSPAQSRAFAVPASPCGAPATARAYSLNATVVPWGALGYLTLWAAGSTQPLVSTLNAWEGLVASNAAIVPAGTNGGISVYGNQTTDVVLDVNGYFAP